MSNKAVIMNALTQMNERPSAVSQSLRAFQRSARVLSNNHPRLTIEYLDQWVAAANRTVIAHGESLEQVLADADATDTPRANVIVRFIETDQRTLVL